MTHRRSLVPSMMVGSREIEIRPLDTIGSALLRAGYRVLRRSSSGRPRGLFCGMGVCHDCLVSVEGEPNVRACITPATPGLSIGPLADEDA